MNEAGETISREPLIVLRLRKRLEAWLRKTGTRAKLLDWLKGYELPAVGHTEEPYVWMLRALSFSEAFYRRELARRIALLIEKDRPHERLGDDYDDELLYNLLYLCAGLRCREELGEPLRGVYDFFSRADGARALPIEGRYDLRGALRDAIIPNQIDGALGRAWRQMLGGRPHALLRGSAYAGFDGLVHMPERRREHYEPAIGEIGWALARMAEHLKDEKDRHRSFRRLVEHAQKAWLGHGDWDREMMEQAIANDWPAWMALRLDNLAVKTEEAGGTEHFLIWNFYLKYLRSCEPELVLGTPFFGGLVVDVWLNEESSRLLNFMLVCVEDARRDCPNAGHINVQLAASEALKAMTDNYWQKRMEKWPDERQKDSMVFRHLCEGRIKTIVDSRPPQKQQMAQKALQAVAGYLGR